MLRKMSPQRTDELVEDLAETALAVREIAALRVLDPSFRKRLAGLADLIEVRAGMLAQTA